MPFYILSLFLCVVDGLLFPLAGVVVPILFIYRGDIIAYLKHMQARFPNGFGVSIGGRVYFMFTDRNWSKEYSTSNKLGLVPLAIQFFGPVLGTEFTEDLSNDDNFNKSCKLYSLSFCIN